MPNVYLTAGKWLRVVSEDFLGPCVRSPLGDFVLAWENAGVDRASGEVTKQGRWFLIRDERILIRGAARKVLAAAVSNPGTFLIACGPRNPGELAGTVYVVEPDGAVLIKESLTALPGPAAIADDGSHAVCQATLGPPEGADTGLLILYDVERRKIAWRIEPPTGWASRLDLDSEDGVIIASYGTADRDGRYRYSFEGECLGAAPALAGGFCITEPKPEGTEIPVLDAEPPEGTDQG